MANCCRTIGSRNRPIEQANRTSGRTGYRLAENLQILPGERARGPGDLSRGLFVVATTGGSVLQLSRITFNYRQALRYHL